jgi:hypothetical protein
MVFFRYRSIYFYLSENTNVSRFRFWFAGFILSKHSTAFGDGKWKHIQRAGYASFNSGVT